MIVYVALVSAYPFRWRIKAFFLPFGLVVIYVFNLARLVAVGILSRYVTDVAFDIIHDILFQTAMVLVVLILWIIMLAVQRNRRNKHIALFVLCVTVVCVILELLFIWLASLVPHALPISATSFITPAYAIIICAFGENWKRKAPWLLGTTILFFSGVFLLINSGQLLDSSIGSPLSYAMGLALYVIIYLGIPLGSIILFIGRRPNRLWGNVLPEKDLEKSLA
jgi:exosortase/archaeosortase family protein